MHAAICPDRPDHLNDDGGDDDVHQETQPTNHAADRKRLYILSADPLALNGGGSTIGRKN
jgi:hypothetical protein